MKKKMKTHHHPTSGWQVHDATWFGMPTTKVNDTETAGIQHLNASVAFPAECDPIRRESRIAKFLKNL